MRKFYFLGGLPRAGSTLLCNILAQNPEIYATHTSGCLEVLFKLRNCWDDIIEHKAHPLEEAKRHVLKGILENYYWGIEEPIVVDKSRGWLAHIEMLEWILDGEIKVIVPVRDLRDVLASFEKLWRAGSKSRQTPTERDNYIRYQKLENRLAIWCEEAEVVGLAVNRIKDAVARGFKDRMHFVDYDILCREPDETLESIYEFLGLEPFKHNFDYVEQVTTEDDSVHGFGVPLHKIRSKVEPQPPQHPEILGQAAHAYVRESLFWKTL